MHRLPVAIARFIFVMVIGAVATVLGTLLALLEDRSDSRVRRVLRLLAPLPILFHRPFLRGVVWPILGVR